MGWTYIAVGISMTCTSSCTLLILAVAVIAFSGFPLCMAAHG